MPGLDPRPILGPGGAVAKRLRGYEPRDEQLRMADAVAAAINRGSHLMVEAGTGVGKSFAYLVPAILDAAEQGKKIVVSTHTISLQEQLLEKDVPVLRAVMPHEFSAVLVKGRSNYLSLRRLEAASNRAASIFTHRPSAARSSAWAAFAGPVAVPGPGRAREPLPVGCLPGQPRAGGPAGDEDDASDRRSGRWRRPGRGRILGGPVHVVVQPVLYRDAPLNPF